jgi:hypothetical protein
MQNGGEGEKSPVVVVPYMNLVTRGNLCAIHVWNAICCPFLLEGFWECNKGFKIRREVKLVQIFYRAQENIQSGVLFSSVCSLQGALGLLTQERPYFFLQRGVGVL